MLKKILRLFLNREVISYLVAGVLTTVINWLTYTICIGLYGDAAVGNDASFLKWEFNLAILISNSIAWVVAVLFAYFSNRYFVFQNRAQGMKESFREFIRFMSSRIATGILEIIIPSVLIGLGLNYALFGIEGFTAKVVTSVIVIILNYIFSKLFVFKKANDKDSKDKCVE